jgi:hypothetical protein
MLLTLCFLVLILGTTGCQQAQEPTELAVEQESAEPGVGGASPEEPGEDETPQQRLERIKKEYAAKQQAPVPRRDDAGHLSVDKTNYDFGAVAPRQRITGQFTLTNDGKESVKFKIGKSCGCTVPQIKTDTLKPGESIPLEIIFTAPTNPGRVSKKVWADVESPGQPAKLDMSISANVREIIQFEPKRLSFKLQDSAPEDISLVLKSTDNTSFKITGYSIPFQALTVEYDKEARATQHELTVKADPEKLRQASGRTLIVNIDHPELRQISVPFEVTHPFSAYPATRAFLNIRPGQPSVANITVVSNFDEPFELGGITSEQGLVKVLETTKQEKGYLVKVEMTTPNDSDKIYFNDFLNITIKDHPEDTLKVRCYGRVKR